MPRLAGQRPLLREQRPSRVILDAEFWDQVLSFFVAGPA
jgi:hypothetical protein